MNDNNFFAHVNLNGQDPGDRITSAGYTTGPAMARVLPLVLRTTATALKGLIIDTGVSDLGHRRHCWRLIPFSKTKNRQALASSWVAVDNTKITTL